MNSVINFLAFSESNKPYRIMILINTNPFWVFTLMSPYGRCMFLTCLEIILYGHFSFACHSVLVAEAPVAVYGIWSQSKTTHNHIDHLNSPLSTTPSDPDAPADIHRPACGTHMFLMWQVIILGISFFVLFLFFGTDWVEQPAGIESWNCFFCCNAKHTLTPLWKRSVLLVYFKS